MVKVRDGYKMRVILKLTYTVDVITKFILFLVIKFARCEKEARSTRSDKGKRVVSYKRRGNYFTFLFCTFCRNSLSIFVHAVIFIAAE